MRSAQEGPTRETEKENLRAQPVTQSRDEERVDFCHVYSRQSSLPNQCPWREKWRKNKVISVGE